MRTIGITIFLISILLSCQNHKKTVNPSINGVWKSVGSGWVLEITDSTKYAFYDLTSISCLPQKHGKFEDLGETTTIKSDTLTLLEGILTYQFTKADALPQLCQNVIDSTKAQDPLYNFEVFAETVKEHYAFFELNNINWNQLYQEQKSKIAANPSDAHLYLIIEETLEKLNDNHAFLEATDEVYDGVDKIAPEEEESESELPEYGDLPLAKMVSQHHLQKEMTRSSWLIQWGLMTDEIGFIQIKTMWLYPDLDIPKALQEELGFVDAFIETRHKLYEADYIAKEVEAAGKIMDKVMYDLSNTESIVIDVRFNGGGQDAVSLEILRRFAPETKQVFTQKIRYGDQFTDVLPISIWAHKNAYIKPVYVLTSPQTGSAAEAFSLATMELDHVKRIGDQTMGALSTSLDKTLPNGWVFSISNEIGMDNNGKSYENIGIPVDYEIDYPEDRQTFFRSVANDLDKDKQDILEAIEILAKK